MNLMPQSCPICGEPFEDPTPLSSCDTALEGHFEPGRLARLSPEQFDFVETFIRCEGRLNRMERELGLSYPTLRLRLTEVIRALGFTVGPEANTVGDEERHRILDHLAAGQITSEQAMRQLQGES
jgi:hypothetical protein